MTEELSIEDSFQNSYFYFIKALTTLSKEAAEQCEIYGHFNVAWELQDDVSTGMYLLKNNDVLPFSNEQKLGIVTLCSDLSTLPPEVIKFTKIKQESFSKMSHPCWKPLRIQAKNLLELLQPVTQINQTYFSN